MERVEDHFTNAIGVSGQKKGDRLATVSKYDEVAENSLLPTGNFVINR